MAQETKIVKGGFRATLALIIAIIAIIISVVAYSRTGENSAMRAQIDKLKATVQDVQNETSQKLDQVRQQTASALENLGKSLKQEKEQK
jgi:predicted PurR-regulated permease PerM